MRWPIQFQLLLPMLTVVVLAIALASFGSAYFGGLRARQAQEDALQRVVTTLTEGKFPRNEVVLRQMGGLTGAEFVLLDRNDAILVSTLPLGGDDLTQLQHTHNDEAAIGLAGRPTILLAGRSYLSQRVRVESPDPRSGARSLVVLYPEDRWVAVMRQAAYPAIGISVLAIAAVVLVTTWLAHRFVQPIRQLGDRAAAIAHGDFQPVVLERRDDEIRDLAESINQMSEQLGHYEVQVRRHEQLRTLDRLGAGMAHQLRNAATGGRMAIELHRRECVVGQNSESLDVALRQLQLMESYLQRFMALGRDQAMATENISLATVVEDALALVQPACTHVGIELDFVRPEQALNVQGDPEALRQLILNLVMNAVEAAAPHSPQRPQIRVALQNIGQGRAALHVSDTGPGPSPDVADRLFEPFVTGKPEGVGLGLYVARQVAESHHGSIRCHRQNNRTCFTVELPLLPNP